MTEEVTHKRTARGERILRKREPQLIENPKKCLILKGSHTSTIIQDVLLDVARLTKPHCVVFSKKNDVLPFEDANSLEFFETKNDCSMFALGSHTKKRQHNLILGRTYDGHILDMIEFGVDPESFRSMAEFTTPKKAIGSKPLFIFQGSQWESDTLYGRVQNLLLDMFRGVKLDMLSLQGIDHAFVATVEDGKIYLRVYSVSFRKSGTKVPTVHLELSGPAIDLTVRRHQLGGDDMWKAACKQPKAAVTAKVKNVSKTSMGDKVGRIHMKKQNLDKMDSRRATALRGERHSLKRSSSDAGVGAVAGAGAGAGKMEKREKKEGKQPKKRRTSE